MSIVPPEVGPTAATLHELGVLAVSDLHVAEAVGRLGEEDDQDVLLGAAFAARAPRQAHVCVELDDIADRVVPDEADDEALERLSALTWPGAGEWVERLAASAVVGARDDGGRVTPLILDGRRLYLDRYWRYQVALAGRLRERATGLRDDVDLGAVAAELDRLFPLGEADGVDRQRLAAALTALRDLTVVSGAPGTGKTTVIVRILALLLATVDVPSHVGELRIALAAPTGKAAVRMQEAIREELEELDVTDEVREHLGDLIAKTLHRLLGWRSRNTTRFWHDEDNPLPYDVIVVDEASMASLALVSKLLAAVPDSARLLLVGDRDQLASVDAGAVLGDICGPVRAGAGSTLRLSDDVLAVVEPLVGEGLREEAEPAEDPGVWDSIVHLEHFYRFGPDSGIGAVARGIQRADRSIDDVVGYLRGERTELPELDAYPDVALAEPDDDEKIPDHVRVAMVDGYVPYVEAALSGAEPTQVIAALERQRILCALRRGPHGVHALNENIEAWLAEKVPGFEPRGAWYLGRPVMVTHNDYGIRLFNGDVGVVVHDPEEPGRKVVAFPTTDGSARLLAPSRIPPCETVFATSIHKGQGSQFDRAFVVLPGVSSRILTRELIYTAVTRAKERVTVVASEPILREGLGRPVQRASGLQEELWLSGGT